MLSRQTAPLAQWPLLARLGAASLLAAVTVFATFALRLADAGSRFLFAYPAVLVAAYVGGRYAGYCATLIIAVLLGLFEVRDWAGTPTDWAQLATLVLFVGIGAGAATLLSRLKSANREAALANLELARSHDEARAANEQTDLLLLELRHRVKNDIANAVSLLRLQAKKAEEPTRSQLETAASRLLVLAQVHQRLSRQGPNPVVDIAGFLDGLCSDIRATALSMRSISLEASFDSFEVESSDAVAIGLIVNELVTNAVKYAFDEAGGGTIKARVAKSDGRIEISVSDDGGGFDAGEASGGLGYRLVRNLASQLRGEFTYDTGPTGTRCNVLCKRPPSRPGSDD